MGERCRQHQDEDVPDVFGTAPKAGEEMRVNDEGLIVSDRPVIWMPAVPGAGLKGVPEVSLRVYVLATLVSIFAASLAAVRAGIVLIVFGRRRMAEDSGPTR